MISLVSHLVVPVVTTKMFVRLVIFLENLCGF